MAYESYCAACTYLGESVDCYGKYWCPKKGEDHYASDPKCYSFCEAYGRSDSARRNMYENSASHSSSGCYITTIMCEILGFPDNHHCLEILRNFRNEKMTTTEENIKLIEKVSKLYIKIGAVPESLETDKVNEVIKCIENDLGEIPVFIYFEDSGHINKLARKWWVRNSEELKAILINKYGKDNVKFV